MQFSYLIISFYFVKKINKRSGTSSARFMLPAGCVQVYSSSTVTLDNPTQGCALCSHRIHKKPREQRKLFRLLCVVSLV